jgi:hypothetical protein
MISFQKISNQLVLEGDAYIRQHGLDHFHEYAAKLLMNSEILEYFNFEEVLKLALTDRSTPQNFKSFEFSDLPLTISRGESCFIDLYFWRRRPTTIHNHHFSGAFMGLMGKNVDLEFSFSPSKKVGEFHELGVLKLSREKTVGPGDVVAIAPLDGFIHQNHHQDDLTVNLCFRTLDLTKESLSGYLYSGLRYTKDSQLLMRVERLKRLLGFGPVDPKVLSMDEAMAFLIQNNDSGSAHPRFLKLKEYCREKVTAEAGINLQELLQAHGKMIEDLEDQYE